MEEKRENIMRLMVSINRIDGLYYFISRKIGVKSNTLSLLYALSDGKPHSQKEICNDWLIPKTTINTVVKECVKDGYVTLSSIGHKEKSILLTDSGKLYAKRLLDNIMDAEQDAMDNTTDLYSDEFVDALEYFEKLLDENFSKIAENQIGE